MLTPEHIQAANSYVNSYIARYLTDPKKDETSTPGPARRPATQAPPANPGPTVEPPPPPIRAEAWVHDTPGAPQASARFPMLGSGPTRPVLTGTPQRPALEAGGHSALSPEQFPRSLPPAGQFAHMPLPPKLALAARHL